MNRKYHTYTCPDCIAMNGGETIEIDGGSIRQPGKFEAEGPEIIHFYHLMIDGSADDCACGAAVMIIDEEDAGFFPDLRDSIGGFVHLTVSDSGFVSMEIVSEKELDDHQAEIEADESEESD